tara:strand:- start:856 stop:1218 length:363 start_codon:yes stop_codon:yes gene_type:complete
MKLLVGTDIESVDRFKKMLQQKRKLIKNIFFESEYNYAFNKSNSEQSLTGIWCAKEAVVKSFSQIKSINIKDVEIICAKNCAPKVSIGKFHQNDFNFEISISISHTKDFATAIALLSIDE